MVDAIDEQTGWRNPGSPLVDARCMPPRRAQAPVLPRAAVVPFSCALLTYRSEPIAAAALAAGIAKYR